MKRDDFIDLLRGIAISIVILHHFDIAYRLGNSIIGDILTSQGMHLITRNGNYGVTIFFVISGFLITQTAIIRWGDLGRIDLLGFYYMRVARIAPALALFLLIVTTLGLAGVPLFGNDGIRNPTISFLV